MSIKRSYFKNGLILLHILFAIVGLYIYLFNYRLSENLLIQKTLNKQFILAKAGSSSVENLLKNVQNQLSSFIFSFARINESSQIDKDATRAEFIGYMQRAQLPVNGIALYDEKGTLTIIENRQDIRIGENQDFSQTAFIKWSKNPVNKDKTFISTPYVGTAGASIGKIIIIIAEPIYFGNAYKGTLAIRLLVNDFTNAFISPLISSSDEDTFVLDRHGVVIAGNKNLINQNLFTYAQQQNWSLHKDFTNKLKLALRTDSIQTTWTFQNPKEKSKLLLVGVSKIDIPNTDKDLYMIVTTSKEGITTSLRPLLGYGLVWLGFGVFTTILGGLIVILLRTSE